MKSYENYKDLLEKVSLMTLKERVIRWIDLYGVLDYLGNKSLSYDEMSMKLDQMIEEAEKNNWTYGMLEGFREQQRWINDELDKLHKKIFPLQQEFNILDAYIETYKEFFGEEEFIKIEGASEE